MRNIILSVFIRLWLAFSSLHTRLTLALGAMLGTVTLPVHAEDTLFGMLDTVAEGADKSGKSLLKLAKFGGIGLVLLGVILWVAKKKNPQISWGWVLTAFGAGFVLIAIDQFIKKGQSTIQLNPVDVG
ncbi:MULTISPECIES: DUF6750 family protein [unclassified Serratia (in: enterobacteria)]|uniref:DUF6750 family protein n=1 Tax=unclassified Serratia (in: enterobacteria) TaxID=2647522 RepID=UPI0030765495